jgi:hypothetical protein
MVLIVSKKAGRDLFTSNCNNKYYGPHMIPIVLTFLLVMEDVRDF